MTVEKFKEYLEGEMLLSSCYMNEGDPDFVDYAEGRRDAFEEVLRTLIKEGITP